MVGDGAILTPDSCSAGQNTWENVSRVSEFFFVCQCNQYRKITFNVEKTFTL